MNGTIDPRLENNPHFHQQQASQQRVQELIAAGWGATQAGMQVQKDNQRDAQGLPRELLSTVQHDGIDGRGTPPDPSLGYGAAPQDGASTPVAGSGEQGAPATFAVPTGETLGAFLLRHIADGRTGYKVNATKRDDGRVLVMLWAEGGDQVIDLLVDGNTLSPLRG